MANYLVPAAGRPSSATGAGAPDHPGLANSEHYRVKIYRRGESPLNIEGNLGGDFAIQATSNWEDPLNFANSLTEQLAGGAGALIGGGVGQATGQSLVGASGVGKNIVGSAKTWGGGSELEFDLTIRIDAIEDTYKELIEPMKNILKTSLPQVRGLGNLAPPGPTALSIATGGFKTGGTYTAEEWANALKEKFENEAYHLRVGSFFHMFPCIIGNVSAQLSPTFEHETGNPMFIEFTIQIRSYLTTTSQDIDNWVLSKPR